MNFAVALILMLSQVTAAPAPSASSGATGICKDGSFTTSAVKDGACRGHKGIQTWYNPTVPSLPAPTPGTTTSRQAPTVAPASRSLPAPTPVPSASASVPAPALATPLASRPVPATTLTPATRPAPTQSPAVPSIPAPQPGRITVKSGIAGERASLTSMPPAEGGGPGLVWVNTSSKVYHCPGSDFYGKTKSGAYMSEAEAKSQGAHPNRNKPCASPLSPGP